MLSLFLILRFKLRSIDVEVTVRLFSDFLQRSVVYKRNNVDCNIFYVMQSYFNPVIWFHYQFIRPSNIIWTVCVSVQNQKARLRISWVPEIKFELVVSIIASEYRILWNFLWKCNASNPRINVRYLSFNYFLHIFNQKLFNLINFSFISRQYLSKSLNYYTQISRFGFLSLEGNRS